MVYGGKPSRGCQTCKTRKIKCDESRPTCSQCVKSSRTCLGYKDEADLIFRNQNEKVAKDSRKSRIQRSGALKSSSSQNAHNAGELQISRKSNSQPMQSGVSFTKEHHRFDIPLLVQPSSCLEEEVVHAYFTSFSTLYQNDDTVREFLPYLVPMYTGSVEGSALRLATRAAALCAISQLPGQQRLTYPATVQYSKSIMAVASALQDPIQARSDETLQATLLLGVFESIKSSNKSINAWSNHVDGATAIVRARGVEQFSSAQSISLFRATRTQMIINCIRQEIAPPDFPGEDGWLGDFNTVPEHMVDLTRCGLQLPVLLAQAKSLIKQDRQPESLRSMSDLIEEAYTLQAIMTDVPRKLDEKWQARTMAYLSEEPIDVRNSEAWVGPVHEYVDIHIASVLNKLRSCIMFSTWIVLECIEWLSPDSYTQDGRWQHSKYVEQMAIDDICSSVPFHLRWNSPDAKTKAPDQVETIADLIGGLSLVWPLGAAARSPRVSAKQKAWIWGRLGKISQDCGLEQASLLDGDVRDVLNVFFNRSY